MSVRGLFETHLTVADLPRSVAFYRDIVGLPVALEAPERGAAFHWIGQPGQAMLGLWSIGSAPMRMQLHIAFGMSRLTCWPLRNACVPMASSRSPSSPRPQTSRASSDG